jgi:hypothetical protein
MLAGDMRVSSASDRQTTKLRQRTAPLRALCERAIGAPIERWKDWLRPLERRAIARWTRFAGRRAAR